MARKFLTMAAAAALALGPTVAQAAAPLSVANSPARASAVMEDSNELRGSTAPVLIGLLLVILLVAIVTGDSRNEPTSP